jgi:hypothetical protein
VSDDPREEHKENAKAQRREVLDTILHALEGRFGKNHIVPGRSSLTVVFDEGSVIVVHIQRTKERA